MSSLGTAEGSKASRGVSKFAEVPPSLFPWRYQNIYEKGGGYCCLPSSRLAGWQLVIEPA